MNKITLLLAGILILILGFLIGKGSSTLGASPKQNLPGFYTSSTYTLRDGGGTPLRVDENGFVIATSTI